MPEATQLKNTLKEFATLIFTLGQQQIMQYTNSTGLSHSQLKTLGHLYAHSGAGISAMGTHLGTTDAAASQLIDRLVNQGLVERNECPQDRRKKQVVLTEKGRSIIESMANERSQMVDHILAEVPPEKQPLVIEALENMTDAAIRVQQQMNSDISGNDKSSQPSYKFD
jgi:DNA-binding MarR family transcriptional regulator